MNDSRYAIPIHPPPKTTKRGKENIQTDGAKTISTRAQPINKTN